MTRSTAGMVMSQIRNYFESCRYTGRFAVREGSLFLRKGEGGTQSAPCSCSLAPSDVLSPLPEPEGTWIRVTGSRFSDGVHCPGYDTALGADEEFEGEVWILSPPPDFQMLCDEITEYVSRHPEGVVSERFGEYSRVPACHSWQQQFAGRLNEWRRMFV